MRLAVQLQILCLISGGACCAQQPAHPPVEVLSPRWIALHFDPQFPHGRHTQNPLPGDALALPLPDSQLIKGQAGQSSDNQSDMAEFPVPVPDVAADAGVDRAIFLGDMKGRFIEPLTLEGIASVAALCPLEACAPLNLSPPKLPALKSFGAEIKRTLNQTEFTLEFQAKKESNLELYDATGPNHFGPTLLLHTRGTHPTGYRSDEQSGLVLPKLDRCSVSFCATPQSSSLMMETIA